MMIGGELKRCRGRAEDGGMDESGGSGAGGQRGTGDGTVVRWHGRTKSVILTYPTIRLRPLIVRAMAHRPLPWPNMPRGFRVVWIDGISAKQIDNRGVAAVICAITTRRSSLPARPPTSTTAMSLYGGIKFSTKNLEDEPEQRETPRPADTDAGSLPPSQSRQKQPAAFSSALKFAPRINKKPQKQPAPSAHVTALPLPLNPSTVEGTADIVRSAEPVLHSRSPAAQEENDAQLVFGPDGLPLAKAPAMTIGAKAKGGYRDRLGNDVSGEKKKKKKKVGTVRLPGKAHH